MNTEQKEKVLISTIFECEKYLNTGETGEPIQKLFESVFDVNNETISDYNVIQVDKYNTFAYLKNVKSLLESKDFNTPDLIELRSTTKFNLFNQSLTNKINELRSINDYYKLGSLPDLVIKTKLFAKQPLNIYGFNLFDIDKFQQLHNIKDLYGIVYNDSDKHLLIAGDNVLYAYDINTGLFDLWNNIRDNRLNKITKINKSNFKDIIENKISKNIIILLDNSDFKYSDNLYRENSIMNKINSELLLKKQQESVIK